jgi:predicted RNase H-like nuclease (RuvC/YqgF family)
MTASVAIAQDEIWRNERGNIEMSPDVFMERERYILKLEARCEAIESAWKTDRELKEEYRAKLDELESALNEERTARNDYEKALQQRHFKNILVFFGAGILAGALTNN